MNTFSQNNLGTESSEFCSNCGALVATVADGLGETYYTNRCSDCPAVSAETRALAEDTFGRIERSIEARDAFARR